MSLLYLGLDPSRYKTDKAITHLPLIEIVPRPLTCPKLTMQFSELPHYTHILFTSQTTVDLFITACAHYEQSRPKAAVIAIGRATAERLKRARIDVTLTAKEKTQEGIMDALSGLNFDTSYIFYPRSSRARANLTHYLAARSIRHQVCDLYDTHLRRPDTCPNPDHFEHIVFTSPSTVDAYLELYKKLPHPQKIITLGPVTEKYILTLS